MRHAARRLYRTLVLCTTVLVTPSPNAHAQNSTLFQLLPQLERSAPKVSKHILELALRAASCAQARTNNHSPYLGIIDYSLPSSQRRFWLFDLAQKRLLREELVAHGRESGDAVATRFSNEPGSLQSSLGLFETGGTYNGEHGYSLYLHGLEKGFNDRAYDRAIVMHGASYVSDAFVSRWQRLGRSWGCPALSVDVAPKVIDYLKDGALLFAYYPDEKWLGQSEYLNGCEQ
ncbi:MAG: murein L,D-transpeptidase catalytic domain family protein [Bdellovibrionota bacterium]